MPRPLIKALLVDADGIGVREMVLLSDTRVVCVPVAEMFGPVIGERVPPRPTTRVREYELDPMGTERDLVRNIEYRIYNERPEGWVPF